jgi:UDP-N-acetylglucosamine--N-acetylmuramyl-(pentapeptide) pyrophosphoryl-undecaprenol N-acetylglucosamine transferase
MAAGAADLIISRGGSTIFEIALWGIPSIIIPLSTAAEDHQRKNAFSYSRSGAATVIEETNLTPHILTAEVDRILSNKELLEKMKNAAKDFAHPDAAIHIAEALIAIGLKHEK